MWRVDRLSRSLIDVLNPVALLHTAELPSPVSTVRVTFTPIF
ncbi:hypothetical protein [Arthrobacter sp. ISL-65]